MVYLIQGELTGLIKIGYSDNRSVKKRLAALQAASPDKLKLLKTIAGGFDMERMIHREFAHLRAFREWFHPGEDPLKFIATNEGLQDLRERLQILRDKELSRVINWKKESDSSYGDKIYLS